MGFSRIVALTEIILLGHVFNWFWRPRAKRRQVRSDLIAKVIPHYFKRYLPAAAAVPLRTPVKDDKNEKIFSVWTQGEENAPKLVKACFRSVRRNCKQELIVLDEKTLMDYIKLPDVIMEKRRQGKIKNAHFVDIVRVELLYNYGGFWLDATGFATGPIQDWIIKEDFFVYLAGQTVGSPYSFMQNCFIRSRRGAYLLDAWRAMILDYWTHENSNFDYFMHQLLFKTLVENDPRAKKFFAEMPHIDQDPTHALWWLYRTAPFNQKLFDKVTSESFFQKTTYRDVKNPKKGTFEDVMLKM